MKKLSFLLLSSLIGLVLLLSSCGQSGTGQTTTDTTDDIPKYGGTVTITWNADPQTFDNAYFYSSGTLRLTNERIFGGDWTRGPAGTNEVSWGLLSFPGIHNYDDKGLAESWEITGENNDTILIKLREGVYFHETEEGTVTELTADDVIFSVDRAWTIPESIMGKAYPAPQEMVELDRYSLTIRYASLSELAQAIMTVCDFTEIWPRDVVEANGNDMRDWKDSIGTGPFILTDYTKGSSATLIRNDNYWDVDPIGLGKGNRLPYLDGIKILIIPDMSTRLAALRTAKSDHDLLPWDMSMDLQGTNPELLWSKAFSMNPYDIYLRMDKEDAPWNNLAVREALTMAIDYQAIADSFYGGEAAWYHYPSPAYEEAADYSIPFEDLPTDIKNLYTFQPEVAAQMIIDAGYEDGFDMNIVCKTADVDLISIYKDYWEKIGVNLVIDQKESAVYSSAMASKAFEDSIYGLTAMNVPFEMINLMPTHTYNFSIIDDERINTARRELGETFLDWEARCNIFKDITLYILENCWLIQCPQPYWFTMWQPWLKNYHGEMSVGHTAQYNWPKWVWIDHDLKEEMTGK